MIQGAVLVLSGRDLPVPDDSVIVEVLGTTLEKAGDAVQTTQSRGPPNVVHALPAARNNIKQGIRR